ncbi:MAG: dimethyl sulfoxide reductase anchor subunit [Fuerstiella sp.]|nr:dimethyl sulfoxide reductase anchor subunit [Fuerstiella sp.]MCP4858722.1 dimethyl sulfoxide reductase anchor subunit [Fuerstiella sp.]
MPESLKRPPERIGIRYEGNALPILDNVPRRRDCPTLIEILLREQQELTAADLFSRDHATDAIPGQARYYSKLLPASPPGPGQQYAFDVDLDRCSGCKACVTACHSLNGLDEDETWRDVGLLIGGTASHPTMQHVTTACHHCLEPACMTACPVDAYEKDSITGIVRHLDDQCFGCQYCTLACPYEVPKYNADKGIVRKCDMCSDRLADGEAPACVQACPHEAIAINVVDTQQVIENAEADHFLPGAPDPQLTLPTTHFKTSRVFPRNTLPADYHAVNPQHPHWPLIVMLVLTQLSVGAFTVGQMLEFSLPPQLLTAFRQLHSTSALGFGLLALAASTMHLGRPQYAIRAVVGLRHSWLSREIVAFGAFAGVACLFAGVCWFHPSNWLASTFGVVVVAIGLAGLLCSVMIYVFTDREFWSFGPTAAKFVLTSAILGIAATWLSILVFGAFVDTPTAGILSRRAGVPLVQALIVTTAAKLLLEASLFRHLLHRRQSPLKRSARLLVGPLAGSMFARVACGLLGGIVMPAFLWNELAADESRGLFLVISVAMLFVACLAGELLERYQFFAACAKPRMPGAIP